MRLAAINGNERHAWRASAGSGVAAHKAASAGASTAAPWYGGGIGGISGVAKSKK